MDRVGSTGQGYDLASFSDATQIGTSYCLRMMSISCLHTSIVVSTTRRGL